MSWSHFQVISVQKRFCLTMLKRIAPSKMSFENYFIINFVHCWIDVFQVMSMEPWKTIFFIESSTGDSNPQPGLKSNHYLNLSLYYPSNYSFYWNIHIPFLWNLNREVKCIIKVSSESVEAFGLDVEEAVNSNVFFLCAWERKCF